MIIKDKPHKFKDTKNEMKIKTALYLYRQNTVLL